MAKSDVVFSIWSPRYYKSVWCVRGGNQRDGARVALDNGCIISLVGTLPRHRLKEMACRQIRQGCIASSVASSLWRLDDGTKDMACGQSIRQRSRHLFGAVCRGQVPGRGARGGEQEHPDSATEEMIKQLSGLLVLPFLWCRGGGARGGDDPGSFPPPFLAPFHPPPSRVHFRRLSWPFFTVFPRAFRHLISASHGLTTAFPYSFHHLSAPLPPPFLTPPAATPRPSPTACHHCPPSGAGLQRRQVRPAPDHRRPQQVGAPAPKRWTRKWIRQGVLISVVRTTR